MSPEGPVVPLPQSEIIETKRSIFTWKAMIANNFRSYLQKYFVYLAF